MICSPSVALIYGEQLLEICLQYLIGSLRQKSLGCISGKSAPSTKTAHWDKKPWGTSEEQLPSMPKRFKGRYPWCIFWKNRLLVTYNPKITLPNDLIYSTVTLESSFLFDSSDILSISKLFVQQLWQAEHKLVTFPPTTDTYLDVLCGKLSFTYLCLCVTLESKKCFCEKYKSPKRSSLSLQEDLHQGSWKISTR